MGKHYAWRRWLHEYELPRWGRGAEMVTRRGIGWVRRCPCSHQVISVESMVYWLVWKDFPSKPAPSVRSHFRFSWTDKWGWQIRVANVLMRTGNRIPKVYQQLARITEQSFHPTLSFATNCTSVASRVARARAIGTDIMKCTSCDGSRDKPATSYRRDWMTQNELL